MTFDDEHRLAARGEGARAGEADDARADDDDVEVVQIARRVHRDRAANEIHARRQHRRDALVHNAAMPNLTDDDARALRGFAATVGATIGVLGAARLSAPRLHLSLEAASFVVFVGAATLAVVALAIGVRAKISRRLSLAAAALAALVLAVVYVSRSSGSVASIAVDASLLLLALAIGGAIGTHVEHPAHLLPAGFIAAAADVLSVTSPEGPTHAIAGSTRALAILAVSFPVPGTTAFAPALGLGDLVFMALIFGVARVHALPYARALAAAFVGVIVAGLASAYFEAAVPALPAIAGAVLLAVPDARRPRKKDLGVTKAACLGAIVFIALQLLRARFLR